MYGSVGASGDLIPLAYAARSLRGVGYAYLNGERLPAGVALQRAGLSPPETRRAGCARPGQRHLGHGCRGRTGPGPATPLV
ncbi:aromatic amino acid lyase [Catenulispora sp. NL8]|uniref:Aromatic amino acid lyase n=1 Tax=Catenulispora pinistramenti TaxID=2705254 RepID=A0ABS5KGG2_9ACTN|nr:aromatic amino acid lyase [Catenulispora pinistramenti]